MINLFMTCFIIDYSINFSLPKHPYHASNTPGHRYFIVCSGKSNVNSYRINMQNTYIV